MSRSTDRPTRDIGGRQLLPRRMPAPGRWRRHRSSAPSPLATGMVEWITSASGRVLNCQTFRPAAAAARDDRWCRLKRVPRLYLAPDGEAAPRRRALDESLRAHAATGIAERAAINDRMLAKKMTYPVRSLAVITPHVQSGYHSTCRRSSKGSASRRPRLVFASDIS